MSVMTENQLAGEGDLSLAEQAYRHLRDRLIMLDIRPGEAINDGKLAAELGIGRTPVREALKRLEGDHLVVSYPRRGTFATVVDITELADVSELRESLEPLAARRAAKLASPALRKEIRDTAAAIATMGGAEDPYDLMRYDIKVHRLIYRAAANTHLEDVLIRYDNLATRIWCMVLDRLPNLERHVHEHVDLLQAVIDGDEHKAAELARTHVSEFEQAVREALFAA